MMKGKKTISELISLSFLIMVAMIGVLVLTITLISAISYTETINNLEHDWDMSLMNTGRHLSDSINLVTTGLRLFELTYDSELKTAFIPFLDAYNRSGGDPYLIDLAALKSQLPPHLSSRIDYYIINKQGMVINTTFPPDMGLDFSQWPEVFASVDEIRQGSSFRSDRAVVGFFTDKKVRKYAYLPTPDHDFVLELSTTIEEFPEERGRFSFLSVADRIAEKNPNIVAISLYDKMGRKILPDNSAPEESDNATRAIVEDVISSQNVVEIPDPRHQTTDTYIFIKSTGGDTVSDNMLDLVARITYTTADYDNRLVTTLYYHLLIGLISVLLGVLLIYLLTRHLTGPIQKIIEDIDYIAQGNLDHPIHHTGSPEFNRLERSINILVTTLKDLIETLQDKEKKLTASEFRYRSLIENQTDLIIRLDNVGTILYVNETFCRYFGLSEVIGVSIYDLLSPDEQGTIKGFISKITDDNPSVVVEHPITLGGGQARWLEWSSTGIFYSGHVIEYQASGRDITDKKEAEIALLESDEKYRSLIANLPDYIVVHRQGRILYVNELAARTLGCSPEDLIGTNIFANIPEDEHQMVTELIRRRLAGELIPDYELHIITKNIGVRVVSVRAVIIPYGGSPALLTVLTDITDKKRSQEEIRKGEIRYYNLIEQLNEGIITTNEQAIITFSNKKMQQMIRYSEKELRGVPYLNIISPEDISTMEGKIMNRMRGMV